MFVNIHTHRPAADEITISTVGVHPWRADIDRVEDIVSAAKHTEAIGEIGLDYACPVSRDLQERVFKAQLEIAERLRLPVVIHCVRAFEPTMKQLATYRIRAVIMHGFIGSAEQMRQAVHAGCYISFGERTFASPKTVAAMRATPLDRIFFETDDSDTAIAEIYRRAASLLGTNAERLGDATRRNYNTIFANENG